MLTPHFVILNDGIPQLPTGGGYRPGPQLPLMRAPHADVVPAGSGAITKGIDGFWRSLFTSHPPMAGRSFEPGVDAIIASNPNFWR